MKLEIPIQFDEEKLKEIVREAVEKLKAEGFIYKDISKPEKQESVREIKGDE